MANYNYAYPYYGNQYPPQTPMPSYMPQAASLRGRQVNTIQEITPNDVAMDGSWSFFPTNDGSCIFAKKWLPDGNISTLKYVIEDNTGDKSNLDQRLDELLKEIRSLQNSINHKSHQNNQNGGVQK